MLVFQRLKVKLRLLNTRSVSKFECIIFGSPSFKNSRSYYVEIQFHDIANWNFGTISVFFLKNLLFDNQKYLYMHIQTHNNHDYYCAHILTKLILVCYRSFGVSVYGNTQ